MEEAASAHALLVPGGEERSGTNSGEALQAASDSTRRGVIFHPETAAKAVIIKLSHVAVVVVSVGNSESVHSVGITSIAKHVVVRASGKSNSAGVLAPV